MKLGFLVTTDSHLQHVTGLVNSAVRKGHEVTLFCMDNGTKLTRQSDLTDLCRYNNVSISLCQHSADHLKVDTSGLSKDIICGSQFNNAKMAHEMDKLIVM